MKRSAWEAAVDLAAELGYNDDETLIHRKHRQVVALIELKRYEEAIMSLGVILGCVTVAPNISQYTQFHVLRIETLLALKDEREASFICKELMAVADVHDPLSRLSIDMCAVKIKLLRGDSRGALSVVLGLLEQYTPVNPQCQCILLCDIIKILLSLGCAESCAFYEKALVGVLATNPHIAHTKVGAMATIARGTICFSNGDFDTAITHFEAAVASAAAILRDGVSSSCFLSVEASALVREAVNNMAVCLMHRKNIAEAVRRLEGLIMSDPTQHLQSSVVIFNLCMMYDLSCAPELSDSKKRALHMLTKEYNVGNLDWSSFRIPLAS